MSREAATSSYLPICLFAYLPVTEEFGCRTPNHTTTLQVSTSGWEGVARFINSSGFYTRKDRSIEAL